MYPACCDHNCSFPAWSSVKCWRHFLVPPSWTIRNRRSLFLYFFVKIPAPVSRSVFRMASLEDACTLHRIASALASTFKNWAIRDNSCSGCVFKSSYLIHNMSTRGAANHVRTWSDHDTPGYLRLRYLRNMSNVLVLPLNFNSFWNW